MSSPRTCTRGPDAPHGEGGDGATPDKRPTPRHDLHVLVASTATAVSAAAAAITAGIAAYVAFMGLFESSRVTHFFHRRVLGSISPGLILTASSTMMQSG
jgi:hypothetical protein